MNDVVAFYLIISIAVNQFYLMKINSKINNRIKQIEDNE